MVFENVRVVEEMQDENWDREVRSAMLIVVVRRVRVVGMGERVERPVCAISRYCVWEKGEGARGSLTA
jgi:hypothetical protein